MPAISVPLDPTKTFSAGEARILSAARASNDRKIYHHPFVRTTDESDISPSVGYTPPETARLALLRYTTSISLPYLSPSKRPEQGVLCTDCNLRMRYLEYMWKAEQNGRRRLGNQPMRRDQINEARKAGARFYVMNPEGLDEKELSIQDHYRIEHVREISKQEAKWREKQKGPALPVLSYKHFWQPPKSENMVRSVAVSKDQG